MWVSLPGAILSGIGTQDDHFSQVLSATPDRQLEFFARFDTLHATLKVSPRPDFVTSNSNSYIALPQSSFSRRTVLNPPSR